jgi:hypothetical protein
MTKVDYRVQPAKSTKPEPEVFSVYPVPRNPSNPSAQTNPYFTKLHFYITKTGFGVADWSGKRWPFPKNATTLAKITSIYNLSPRGLGPWEHHYFLLLNENHKAIMTFPARDWPIAELKKFAAATNLNWEQPRIDKKGSKYGAPFGKGFKENYGDIYKKGKVVQIKGYKPTWVTEKLLPAIPLIIIVIVVVSVTLFFVL